jgi:23S rRNA (cytosine1962-C5)-methyltransferase
MKGGRSTPKLPATAKGSAPGELVVNAYSTGWLKRGFPWVYPAEVLAGRARPGEVVRLRGEGGAALGTAVADNGWLAARRFRRDDGPLDTAWLRARVEAALARRRSIGPDTSALRLVNAESDELPGIRADRWGSELVVTVDSGSLIPLAEALGTACTAAVPGLTGAWLAERRDPRDTETRLPEPRRLLGSGPDDLVVEELGLRYEVRPSLGKDAGLFTDMRENRAWLAPHWRGTRVLNLFAHTGAFSVSARHHGAEEVVSVDLSEAYLARARRNFELNALDAGELLADDAFRALDRFRRQGRRFDRVVVDPPGYSHSGAGAWQGEKEWPRLAAACLRVLAPGGWLIAASNLGSQSPKHFGGALAEGAERAERQLRLLHEGSPGPDHPAALHFPESRYLKFWVMEAE